MSPAGFDSLQTEHLSGGDLSLWDEMERKQLLGPTARKCFQCFSFGLAGWLWALVTCVFCIYGAVLPNAGLVDIYGEKATRMVSLMLGLSTLCSMKATRAAAILLESDEFGQLLTNYETRTAVEDSREREEIINCLIFDLVTGILLCPSFGSDKSYFAGWLALLGWMTVYSRGYKHVLRQVNRLSRCLVQRFMDDMHAGPREWKGTGKFWQDTTKKHYDMDLKIERAWTLASWVFAPDVASLALFAMMAWVACLSAAVNSTNCVLALASLLGVLPPLYSFGRKLQDIANITNMCMSTASTSKGGSIMSLAIAQSGHSPYSQGEIQKGGYDSVDDERTDHTRFLAYLKINKCGVEMFGVLIDSGLILGVLANVATAFLALLSYLLATLDIHEDDMMRTLRVLSCLPAAPSADGSKFYSTYPSNMQVPWLEHWPDADIFAYLCERPPDGSDLVYVTEGILRLSKRKEEDAPDHEKAADPDRSQCGNSAKAAETDAGFVPHHSYRRKDIEMLPAAGELTTARLKMFAAAYRFRAGSKMVLVIAPD
ncbi:Ank2, partial [Symbiodinium sp. CCMP2456]